MTDKLRRPDFYVPLSVRFITGQTGSKLLEKFGRDGPLVWAAYLAACKLNRPEGEIVYASEAEGWALLGLTGHEPDFTLNAFFTFTGRIKKTRRTRSGRVSYVVCTAWGRWTKAQKQEADRLRKSRKRAQTEPDIPRNNDGNLTGQESDLEVEVEREVEKEPEPAPEPVLKDPASGDNIPWAATDQPNGAGAGSGDLQRLDPHAVLEQARRP